VIRYAYGYFRNSTEFLASVQGITNTARRVTAAPGVARAPAPAKSPAPHPCYRHYAFREIGTVEIESESTARGREQKAHGGVPRIFLRPV